MEKKIKKFSQNSFDENYARAEEQKENEKRVHAHGEKLFWR
jgi:hypothetical protein